MATRGVAPASQSLEGSISINSYDTALCIVPPRRFWPSIDRLRVLYDKGYEKWPPHVNIIYPFVRPDSLPIAMERIQSMLSAQDNADTVNLRLAQAGVFQHKHDNTIYLYDDDKDHITNLKRLRGDILKSLGQKAQQNFQMHMTVAQSEDASSSMHRFLKEKVGLLPAVEWEVQEIHILIRERVQLPNGATSQMKTWGVISLTDSVSLSRPGKPLPFYEMQALPAPATVNTDEEDGPGEKDELQSHPPYYYDDETDIWLPLGSTDEFYDADESKPGGLSVGSYNIMAEFHYPPSQARYPLLLKNILSRPAYCNILVLQEVTDHFLSYLLADPDIRVRFPFCSHGPPSQDDIEPLPNFLNMVILSRFAFDWEHVSFRRKHKGALVARFKVIGDGPPLILATVHLTCGLTDGSIAAKKTDVQKILKYVGEKYPSHPWVLAGDFNMSTSSFTIDSALEKKGISPVSAAQLQAIDEILLKAGMEDAWATASRDDGLEEEDEEALEGEHGATYDPLTNEVAAAIVGSGYNMRPQRYDRVYFRGEGKLDIAGFNLFGKERGRVGDEENYASDHWGVRCLLKATEGAGSSAKISEEIGKLVIPVSLEKAADGIGGMEEVKEALAEVGAFPSDEDVANRKAALGLLKRIILDTHPEGLGESATSRLRPVVVVVPVGSYSLGVWTATSDIDVLCIGPFSANTFFTLATQRLRKAEAQEARIIRRVKANTGTMLELEVLGIKMDLQYCPATSVAEQWPQALRAPPSDPIWSLSPSTLSKLKAIRDRDYIQRSIPDITTFRLAHRFIRCWAKSRGIYAARFGFLGGMQISLLLTRVYKLLPNPESVSLPDLLITFFTHYSAFPWATHAVFDPHFHTTRLPYNRSTREPLAILGYFPPTLNTSLAASVPSTRAMATEFERAAAALQQEGMTWSTFLTTGGARDFLTSYKSYIKISIQYWGLSLARGSRFVGWLESRCVMLLVDVARRAPGLNARMWPARFVETAVQAADGGEAKDYQGCYLLGLDKVDPEMSKDELQVALGGLRTALRRFEEQMRGDEKYFDAKSCWMSAEVINRGDLGDLEVDGREWGEYTPGEEEDDDEEEEESQDEAGLGAELEGPEITGRKKKKGKKEGVDSAVHKLETGKKFRTAADVMNRIRWDPEMDSADFVVGYEDRFVGAREKALDAWKSEQTDEEFIPQHRILYFKRKSDGVVVWERRTRKDEIFGSGA
ncbi:hypothetical protein OQA88_11914 [Cercophora sp. LCS_1]